MSDDDAGQRAADPLRLPRGKAASVLAALALYAGVCAGADAARDLAAGGHDPGSWQAASVHHLAQLMLGLLLIGWVGRGRWAAFGLTLANRRTSWHLLTRGFFPVLLVSLLLGHALLPVLTGDPPARFSDGVPSGADLAGDLLFALVIVGVSEEVVFRGLLHTTLARGWLGTTSLLGVAVPVAGLWSAALFMVAHIGVAGWPLQITHFDPRQLLLAFVLGVYYAVAYHRTGSLLAPVVAHNAVDGGILVVEAAVAAATAS